MPKYSISASIISPRKQAATLIMGVGGGDYYFPATIYGTSDFGVIISDLLVIDDLGTPTSPPTDQALSSIDAVKIEGNNYSSGGFLTSTSGQWQAEVYQVPQNAASGSGGSRVLLKGAMFDACWDANQAGTGSSTGFEPIRIEIQWSIPDPTDPTQFLQAPNNIQLFHPGGAIYPGPIVGQIVGCGGFRDPVSNQLVDANYALDLKELGTNAAEYSDPGNGVDVYAMDIPNVAYFTDGTIGDVFVQEFGAIAPNQYNGQGNSIKIGDFTMSGNGYDTHFLVSDPDNPNTSILGVSQTPGGTNLQDFLKRPLSTDEWGIFVINDIGNSQLGGGTSPAKITTANDWNNAAEWCSMSYFSVSDFCQFQVTNQYIPGCTDPLACNYDAAAEINDGTCTYDNYCVIAGSDNNDTSNPTYFTIDATTGTITMDRQDLIIDFGNDQTVNSCGQTFSPATNPFGSDFADGNSSTTSIDRISFAMDINDGNGMQIIDEHIGFNGGGTPVVSDALRPDFVGADNDGDGVPDSASSLGAFTNLGQVLPAGQTITCKFIVFGNGEYPGGCSVQSTTYSITTPNISIVGCTDSTAYNYNANATVDDGTCSICNSGADFAPNLNIDNQAAPASQSGAADGATTFNINAVGSAFAGGVQTGNLIAIFAGNLSEADIVAHAQGTNSSIAPIMSQSWVGNQQNPGSPSVTFIGLTGNVTYNYLVYNPSLIVNDPANNLNGNCYNFGFFTQSYYACTNPSNDPYITNGVPATSLTVDDPSLCTLVSTCAALNQTLGASYQVLSTNPCDPPLISITYSNAVFYNGSMLTSMLIQEPTGSSHDLTAQLQAGSSTLNYNLNASDIPGDYIISMETQLPGSLTLCLLEETVNVPQSAFEVCGCTDQGADNYNPNSTQDDGSCEYSGCTDPTATNFNPQATIDNGTCIFPVFGCTDPNATNYNPAADTDDGSCNYILIEVGCTDPQASNFSPTATQDSGNCIYPGCTDLNAANPTYYTDPNDPSQQILANQSDGSCIYTIIDIPGCTDVAADNYSIAATVDDGSCTYGGNNGTTGPTGPTTAITALADGPAGYGAFLHHMTDCLSKALTRYHNKMIAGVTCDDDTLVHLALASKLLKNMQIDCLFDVESDVAMGKLNNLIKFVLSYCDDCEYDLAESGAIVAFEEDQIIDLDTESILIDTNNNGVNTANQSSFIFDNGTTNITIL
tara:strand:+ start:19705 stop:23310 length:3606 start_codon:yes stop_codon:yes gene_type:complete